MEKLNTNINIILGSESPRRRELLKLMRLDFKTQAMNIDESFPRNLSPIKAAVYLSKKKSFAYKVQKNELLICADTIVYIKNQVLEKPKSKNEAIKMLNKISNKKHFVVTGVTMKTTEKEISFYERSIVYFKKLSKSEISFYTNNCNTLDKAGGYGIQDWIGLIGVKKISGSFYNVMGLPTLKVYEKIIELTK